MGEKKQRKFVGKTSHHDGSKLWFQKAFLSNFMESKTMTGSRSAFKLASLSTNGTPSSTSRSPEVNMHDSCDDDEEALDRQYWNKTFLQSKNEHLNTYFKM